MQKCSCVDIENQANKKSFKKKKSSSGDLYWIENRFDCHGEHVIEKGQKKKEYSPHNDSIQWL